jgi:hypothetical protein
MRIPVLLLGCAWAAGCGAPSKDRPVRAETGRGAADAGDDAVDSAPAADGGDGVDSGADDAGGADGAGADDAGVDSAADSGLVDPFRTDRCPPGMIGVPTAAPTYCIDRYEVAVEGGLAVSAPGTLPSSAISFLTARDTCAATPALDASGAVVGVKRIATATEWEDAADGVVGPGGARFSYGDTWEDRRCAAPDLDGTVWLTALQPTGSLPGCVSGFGLYDAIGNQWEWMDSEAVTDTAAALTRFGDLGLRLWIEDDGGISVLEGDPARLRVYVITAPTEPTVVEGRLFLPSDPITPAEWNGYLLIEGDHPKSGWAPILLREGEGGYWVDSYPAGEGLPVPDKRGCAWYFGRPDDGGCDLDAAVYLHTPTFEGSISFRCAADPLP